MDNQRIIVDTGHRGRINDIVYDPDSDTVFTCGNDGTVRVWSPSSRRLMQRLQVSDIPVLDIAVDPGSSRIAFIESNGIDIFRLSVWDWETGTRQFYKTLNNIPLFLDFSPQGSFLVYSMANWKSLFFLDPDTGASLPYLNDSFGVVSYGLIDPTERRIMTYTPSTGTLIFWSIKSGSSQKKNTLSGLSHITPLPPLDQPKYAAASTGEKLVIINLWNGRLESDISLSDIQQIAVNPDDGEIGCVSIMNNNPVFSKWEFNKDTSILSRRFTQIKDIPDGTTEIEYIKRSLFAATDQGEILKYSLYSGNPYTFGRNELMMVDDLMFKNNHMVLSSGGKIVTITSDYFSDSTPETPDASYVSEQYKDVPLPGKILFEPFLFESILLWTEDTSSEGAFFIFNPSTGYIGNSFHDFESPLISLSVAGDSIIAIEQQGILKMIDAFDYNTTFTYRALGMENAVRADTGEIFLGKSKTNSFESSLIRINPETGETVPLDTPSFLIFDMVYDSRESTLYTLSLEKRGNDIFTTLNRHSGRRLEKYETLYSVDEEDLKAKIGYDRENNRIYTTVGSLDILNISGKVHFSLENNNNNPSTVFVQNHGIYAINSDGTVSMWDKESGKHLFDLYIFKDYSWVIVTRNNYFHSSMRGMPTQHLNFYDGIRAFRGDEEIFNYMKSYRE
jgi:WD40 repeat protein